MPCACCAVLCGVLFFLNPFFSSCVSVSVRCVLWRVDFCFIFRKKEESESCVLHYVVYTCCTLSPISTTSTLLLVISGNGRGIFGKRIVLLEFPFRVLVFPGEDSPGTPTSHLLKVWKFHFAGRVEGAPQFLLSCNSFNWKRQFMENEVDEKHFALGSLCYIKIYATSYSLVSILKVSTLQCQRNHWKVKRTFQNASTNIISIQYFL